MQDNQQLVSRIIYLASLASARSKVDPMLDKLRQVTSGWRDGAPMPPEDHAELIRLEAKLKRYLVTSDPLREFTLAELEQRVQSNEQPWRGSRLNSFLVSVLLTAAAGILLLFVPGLTFGVREVLAISAVFAVLHICIVWMYLSALRNFNQQLRRAFIYICCGIVCFGIYYWLYMLINTFDFLRLPLFKFAGPVELIPLGFLLIYLGLRRYAQLLGVHSRALQLSRNLGALAVVALVIPWLPHHVMLAPGDDVYFRIAMTLTFSIAVEALFAAFIARQLVHSLTAGFASSMRLMYWYLLPFVFLTTLGTPLAYWFPTTTGRAYSLVLVVSGLLPETLLLYIGYTFKRGTGR